MQTTVTALLTARTSLAEELATYLYTQDPEPRAVGVEDLILASCRSNVTLMLDYTARVVPLESIAVSGELLGYTRTMARLGLSHDSIMRGYRRGTTFLIEKWVDQVAALGFAPDIALDLVQHGSHYLLGWLEVIIEQLTVEYRAEMARLSIERSHARLDDIRTLLNGERSIAGADQKLGYRMAGRHLAMVFYDLGDATDHGAALDAAVQTVTGMLGIKSRLAAHASTRTLWCWVPWAAEREIEIDARRAGSSMLIGIGRPGVGIDGFRQSHREALDALRVARGRPAGSGGVVRYDAIDVVALCTTDAARARDFVRFELGALAGDDPASIRQRATLAAFYASDSNFRATAARLGLHHNTIRYRLEQIEDRLGRSVEPRSLALELALRLADFLDTAPAAPNADHRTDLPIASH